VPWDLPWEDEKCQHILVYYSEDTTRPWLVLVRCKACDVIVDYSIREGYPEELSLSHELLELLKDERRGLV
jgi:hypothetical protein